MRAGRPLRSQAAVRECPSNTIAIAKIRRVAHIPAA